MGRLFWILLAVIIIGGIGAGLYFWLGTGKGVQPTQEALVRGELVPQNSDIILYAEVSNILNDSDVQSLYQQYKPSGWPSLSQALAQVEQQYLVNPSDFTSISLFANYASVNTSSPYMGFIARGTWDQNALIDQLEQQSGVTQSEYKGITLYKFTQDGQELAVAFLGEDAAALGTEAAVKDVIDVYKGDADPLDSGAVHETYSSLGSWVKMAMVMPADQRPDTAPFNALDAVGLGLDKSGQTLTTKAVLHFTSSSSAAQAQVAIEQGIPYFKSLIQADTSIPAQTKTLLTDLLDQVSVAQSDSQVTSEFTITISQLQALVNFLQSL